MRIAFVMRIFATGRALAALVPFLCACVLAACGTALKWSGNPPVGLDLIAREISPELSDSEFQETDVPDIPLPRRLRPCCAFGTHLRVALKSVAVPGVEIANVIGVDDLGPHQYDNGALAFERGSLSGLPLHDERNGLIYTCRGGFIDTAHLRDWADWTLALGAHIARTAEKGSTLVLPDEGGRRRIVLARIDPLLLATYGRREVAVRLAQWLAFRLSVWHEIATWFGWSTLTMFSEEASAFSPEDLYSNLLGIRIAGLLVHGHAVASEAVYNQSMNVTIARLLRRFGALPAPLGHDAAHAVDGLWWNSTMALPARQLVRRRAFETATTLTPWLVTRSAPSGMAKQRVAEACAGDDQPISLANPNRFADGNVRLDTIATVEIEVDNALAARNFPFPRPAERRVTQADFPTILTAIRAANAVEFGVDADRPD